jgi:hypothetical protein
MPPTDMPLGVSHVETAEHLAKMAAIRHVRKRAYRRLNLHTHLRKELIAWRSVGAF